LLTETYSGEITQSHSSKASNHAYVFVFNCSKVVHIMTTLAGLISPPVIDQLTRWYRVFLKKLVLRWSRDSLLVWNSNSHHLFIRVCHWILSCASWIQSITSHPIYILILSSSGDHPASYPMNIGGS